jgi:pimeloyl-ACP methyl ester carboxylesterase
MGQWAGFERIDFEFRGHACLLVCPESAAQGRPWVWRTEFFGAFAQADIAMLHEGYHVAYVRLSDMYGCDAAVQEMEQFRHELTERYNLNQKAVLFGFSRGGLYAVNYALTFPEGVDRIYLDAPVLDIRSWPGGYGKGIGGRREWEECKVCYQLTEESAAQFDRNPLDRAEELAAHRIPILIVAGGADDVVPFDENAQPFAERYARAGGRIHVIVKPTCGHHPHSLEDTAPIVRFLTDRN